MNNAEKFKQVFGLYATELWSMPESDFLVWLNRAAETAQNAQDEDLIFRQAAIEALAKMMPHSYTPDGSHPADEEIFRAQEVFADCIEALEILPSAQPDRDVIDDCSYHIYKNISVHTATGGVIAIRYYMEKLYEEIYGEDERPWWMK